MNFIPKTTKNTGNYFCTWKAQSIVKSLRFADKENFTTRDSMSEEFLFGENGILNAFDGVREDLIVVIDDGWDVPYGATPSSLFGSLELDEKRFPSFKGTPKEKLKALSDRVKQLGYKGLGLWVPAQSAAPENVERNEENERLFWEERMRWCNYADVLYLKVDWGIFSCNIEFRKMITESARKFAPKLKIEHALFRQPLFESHCENTEKIKEWSKQFVTEVLPYSDYLRTYDVAPEFRYSSTLSRVADCLQTAQGIKGKCGILNIEDTAVIGAALCCSIGVMRHEFETKCKNYKERIRDISETFCALRWQRIAPPVSANIGEVHIADELLKDVWHYPKNMNRAWPKVSEGEYWHTAPASISRNMPLPIVESDGEKPFVVCSTHPYNNALCIGIIPRVISGELSFAPKAKISVKDKDATAPIGVLGKFDTLIIEFDKPVEQNRIFAQNLLCDKAVEITDKVKTNKNQLILSGELAFEIGKAENSQNEMPAILLKLV